MVDDALVILLAGGAGERLYPLTRDRAKPAVFFGGPYRIIDFTLSNCINSGLRRIFIATQYKSLSLESPHPHGLEPSSRKNWASSSKFCRHRSASASTGTRAPPTPSYQNLYSIVQENAQHVIVLSGDHVYKMDYAKMLRFHKERGAAVTLAAIEIPIQEAYRFGVLSVDEQDKVTGFIEKSKDAPTIPGSPDLALGSMGIYIFDTDVLLKALEADAVKPSSHDFGKDIIPALITELPTFAYRFYDENKKASKYWRDIGTLDAFFDANMDLCGVDPEFNLYDPEWPMRTYQPQAPPAKFVFAEKSRRGEALDSIISPGCIISGSRVEGSVLCPNVRVHSYGVIEQSMLMPGVRVGRHARIRRAIIDRDVLIPRGAVIGFNSEEDRKRHTVTDLGVVVVTEDDDPLVEPIGTEALRIEAEDDGR